MSSFTDVVAGNPTNAADVNQFADKLNGTTSAGLIVSGGAAAFVPYLGKLSSAPGGDFGIYQARVSGDTQDRAGFYIRGSDGYGGLALGPGGSTSPLTLYAQAAGLVLSSAFTSLQGFALDANSPGLPLVIKTANLVVTTTGAKTVLTVNAPVQGFYRISVTMRQGNSVSGNNVSCSFTWTDEVNNTNSQVFQFQQGTTTILATGSVSFTNASRAGVPVTVYAKSGTAIIVAYNDPTNTPNDRVVASVEFLGQP